MSLRSRALFVLPLMVLAPLAACTDNSPTSSSDGSAKD